MNYQELLRKYMNFVAEQEGTTFLHEADWIQRYGNLELQTPFTKQDLLALQELEDGL